MNKVISRTYDMWMVECSDGSKEHFWNRNQARTFRNAYPGMYSSPTKVSISYTDKETKNVMWVAINKFSNEPEIIGSSKNEVRAHRDEVGRDLFNAPVKMYFNYGN